LTLPKERSSVRNKTEEHSAASFDETSGSSSDAEVPRHPGRRLFPLSIVILFLPLLIVIGVSSTVVAHQLSTRSQAESARESSLTLDGLLSARVDLYDEYIPSQAIVVARSYQVSPATLNSLLGVNVQAELVAARRAVDRDPVFGATGAFHTEYAQLVRVRRAVDNATASGSEVAALFNHVGSALTNRWQETFNNLSYADASSDSPTTKSRLSALDSSFGAFTAGLGEENLQGGGSLETLLTTTATPAQVQSLIVSHEQFVVSTRSFPASLGPHGAAAWKSLADGPVAARFATYVQAGIAAGLGHLAPPFANDSSAIGEIARDEVAWANSLTHVVLASSVDLRTATADQADSATHALIVTYALTSVFLVLALGAVLILSRQVRRPLDHIVAAATSVQEGELDIPALDESGPKELALASAAFNEMASTLRAVQDQAIALSGGDLDNPVLRRQLPGRTGAALQTALNQLHRSVLAGETEREALLERATRDSLTGLLNRGAALEALTLDMAAVRRSRGELVLTLFFIDLDNLKMINDTVGHDGGDVAIRAVAEALRRTTRESDVIARFGGDEFIVGWLGSPDSDVPEELAGRISAHVAQSEIGAPEGVAALTCSIGVAVSEPSDSGVETLLERADRALYDAKANGRGQIRWFGRAAAGLSQA
jgi:diguanylate cyclase (GGDEF)-like protein